MTRSNTWMAIGLLTAAAGISVAAAGDPQLIDAVKNGDAAAVRTLLAKKAGVPIPSKPDKHEENVQ